MIDSEFEEVVVRLMLDGARMSPNFCRMIPPSVWEIFLDSCIIAPADEEISSMNFPITFDYSRLLSPLDHDQLVNSLRKSNSTDITSSSTDAVTVSFQTGDSGGNNYPLENVTAQSSARIESIVIDIASTINCEVKSILSNRREKKRLDVSRMRDSVALESFFEAPDFDEASVDGEHPATKMAQIPLALLHQRSVLRNLSRSIVHFLRSN